MVAGPRRDLAAIGSVRSRRRCPRARRTSRTGTRAFAVHCRGLGRDGRSRRLCLSARVRGLLPVASPHPPGPTSWRICCRSWVSDSARACSASRSRCGRSWGSCSWSVAYLWSSPPTSEPDRPRLHPGTPRARPTRHERANPLSSMACGVRCASVCPRGVAPTRIRPRSIGGSWSGVRTVRTRGASPRGGSPPGSWPWTPKPGASLPLSVY